MYPCIVEFATLFEKFQSTVPLGEIPSANLAFPINTAVKWRRPVGLISIDNNKTLRIAYRGYTYVFRNDVIS